MMKYDESDAATVVTYAVAHHPVHTQKELYLQSIPTPNLGPRHTALPQREQSIAPRADMRGIRFSCIVNQGETQVLLLKTTLIFVDFLNVYPNKLYLGPARYDEIAHQDPLPTPFIWIQTTLHYQPYAGVYIALARLGDNAQSIYGEWFG
jgi:hypothetical protein